MVHSSQSDSGLGSVRFLSKKVEKKIRLPLIAGFVLLSSVGIGFAAFSANGHWEDGGYASVALLVILAVSLVSYIVTSSIVSAGIYRVLNEELTRRDRNARDLSLIDTLTGLPNRTVLYQKLEILISRDSQEPGFALVLIDIDDFKIINDNHGHGTGDLLLREMASRIASSVGEKFLFGARLGGDEFLLILDNTNSEMDILGPVHALWQRLTGRYELSLSDYHVTISMGISRFPQDGSTINDLMRRADLALFRVKESGKRDLLVFNHELDVISQRKMLIDRNLRRAIERKEFTLHFQPQLDLARNEVTGFEALLRWNNAELGRVPPSEFIPIAESSGQIIAIGDWVLRKACEFSRVLEDSGKGELNVSVNFSPLQLMQNRLVDSIRKACEEAGVAFSRLTIEVTESVFIRSFQEVASRLKLLRELGSRISLDDFGTGYSSLSYLYRLPFDELKIDKSFIDDLENNHKKIGIVRSLILLSQQHDLEVVAEGVETKAQREILRSCACDKIQGLCVSDALNSADSLAFLSGTVT